jgi:F-type H+-transporting ATPase subunit b
MLIDWFTVGAQTINFLVLLWLMRRFLYRPILNAIAAREKRIADELAAAAAVSVEAVQMTKSLADKTKAFDAEKAALLTAAVTGASAEHDRLLAQAHGEFEQLQLEQQGRLQSTRVAEKDRVRRLVTDEVFSISRRALGDLAGADLEERMVTVFLARFRQLPPPEKSSWMAALKSTTAPAVVRSRFVLVPALRTLIQTAVDENCGSSIPMSFETSPDGVAGLELTASGSRISWNISGYLETLEGRMVGG